MDTITPQAPSVTLPVTTGGASNINARFALPETLLRFCLEGKVAVVTGYFMQTCNVLVDLTANDSIGVPVVWDTACQKLYVR